MHRLLILPGGGVRFFFGGRTRGKGNCPQLFHRASRTYLLDWEQKYPQPTQHL